MEAMEQTSPQDLLLVKVLFSVALATLHPVLVTSSAMALGHPGDVHSHKLLRAPVRRWKQRERMLNRGSGNFFTCSRRLMDTCCTSVCIVHCKIVWVLQTCQDAPSCQRAPAVKLCHGIQFG